MKIANNCLVQADFSLFWQGRKPKKQKWAALGRRFDHIVGHAEQIYLNIDLFEPTEPKAAKSRIALDVAENGFNFFTVFCLS